ncbi:WD40 repeat domain-containing protein [Blastopirellula marina]|uniref:Peptidase C14, caspase catalytic subunit p20 n=1 Tax=Blastopirellula marina DSM 3645 TaxID=314230 RepID=A3ZXB9_9BACT|nr:peptidase C14 [Blastopirellula marina]EAQ78834.1 Peptidase C14, caspase catalytic subunit p20 [Blastopirellula marina DSM 3645]
MQTELTSRRADCPLCGTALKRDEDSIRDLWNCHGCGMSIELAQQREPLVEVAPSQPLRADQDEDQLDRWLSGKPIEQKTPPISRRLHRWAQENWGAVTCFLIALLGISGLAAHAMQNSVVAQRQLADERDSHAATRRLAAQRDEELRILVDSAQIKSRSIGKQLDQARLDARRDLSLRLADEATRLELSAPHRSLMLAAESVEIARATKQHPASGAVQVLFDQLQDQAQMQSSGHAETIRSIAFSADGAMWASGGDDNRAILHAMQSQRAAIPLEAHWSRVSQVRFSPDSRKLATASFDATICLWDVRANDVAQSPVVLSGHDERVLSIDFSADSRWLLSAAQAAPGSPSEILLWDLQAKGHPHVTQTLGQHFGRVHAAKLSPDSRWAFTSSADGFVQLWRLNPKSGDRLTVAMRARHGLTDRVFFSPDSSQLVTVSEGNNGECVVRRWSLGEMIHPEVIATLEIAPLAADVDFAQGRVAIGGEQGAIKVIAWNSNVVTPVVGHEQRIQLVRFLPGGALASIDMQGWIRRTNLSGEEEVALGVKLPQIAGQTETAAISADGQWVAVTNDKQEVIIRQLDPAVLMGVAFERLRSIGGGVEVIATKPTKERR